MLRKWRYHWEKIGKRCIWPDPVCLTVGPHRDLNDLHNTWHFYGRRHWLLSDRLRHEGDIVFPMEPTIPPDLQDKTVFLSLLKFPIIPYTCYMHEVAYFSYFLHGIRVLNKCVNIFYINYNNIDTGSKWEKIKFKSWPIQIFFNVCKKWL